MASNFSRHVNKFEFAFKFNPKQPDKQNLLFPHLIGKAPLVTPLSIQYVDRCEIRGYHGDIQHGYGFVGSNVVYIYQSASKCVPIYTAPHPSSICWHL